MNLKEKQLWRLVLRVAVPLILAVVSVVVVARLAASPEVHRATIQALDDKKTTVMQLTAASTAVSAAITLIPGDVATPIADKLADLSGYFLIVICAIYLEKYLVTITGYIAFVVLIPAACALVAVNTALRRPALDRIAGKLALCGAVLVLVIPASVKVSDMIEATYQDSIQTTLQAAQDTTSILEESAGEEQAEEQDFWSKLVSGVQAGVDKVQNGVSGAMDTLQTILSSFIEALAILIVTSCLIPLLVLVGMVWFIKLLLGADFAPPQERRW